MGHYAKVEDGIVIDVIVADIDYINTLDDASSWIKTSYNTRFGVHYQPDSNTPSADQSKALRKNYAQIGHLYSAEHDMFHAPQPFDSHTLNTETGDWDAPLPKPDLLEGQLLVWDEDLYQSDNTQGWVIIDV